MLGKLTTIRYQFLIAINFVLILTLLLFGFSYWTEWGHTTKKHTDEIRQHSTVESRHHLIHGLQIYEREIQFQSEQMEQLAENLGHSDEFKSFIVKNRINPLKHLLSLRTGKKIFDFAHILNNKGEFVASFPQTVREADLQQHYRREKTPVSDLFEKLEGKPLLRKERTLTFYYLVSKKTAAEFGLFWREDGRENEFVLMTVSAIYSDFGDPIGVLILGKMFRNMLPVFMKIKERSEVDYSVYASKQSSVTTGLHPQSPLSEQEYITNRKPGPYDGTVFVLHHGGSFLCREFLDPDNSLLGLGCSGMPTSMANQSLNRIETILEELKETISFWYIFYGFLAIIISTMMAFFLSLRLTGPLETVTQAIKKLSQKDLNITLPKRPGSTEIDTITKATEIFKDNIKAMGEAESKLREQREEALMSSRIKSQFLGNMGHDLRTPLNAIIGFSEVLAGEIYGKLGHDKYKEYSKDIHFSGRHLLELINNILDVSSIESGKFTMDENWFYLPEIIKQSTRLHQFLSEQSNVVLKAEIDDSVSDFCGDSLRFQQILNNLISNAIKFTPTQGHVDIDCYVDTVGNLVIKVKDTGVGIAETNLSQIFEPFFLGDDKTITPQRGTGLGLFLVKSFVDYHNGSVSVKSELGTGTCFTLTFPKERLRVGKCEEDIAAKSGS